MKVTIYALHLGFGGVEKYIATIANILVKEHDVTIVSTYKTTSMPAFALDKSIKVTYLLPHLLPNNQAFKQACKKKNPFKIVKEGIYACRVLYQRKHQNMKYIKQDDSDVMLSTRIFHNQLIAKYASTHAIKITGEHNHPNGNEKYIQDVLKSCAGFDYFIPISKALCTLYENQFTSNIQVRYIPFCIDESGVHEHVFSDSLNLLNVGRFSLEKGILDLLDVLHDLVHDKHIPVLLHLIGDGDLKQDITAKIANLQLQENVVLHGFQEKQYIYEQYQRASFYVMTSFTESFGIVLLEAMSCGVPCIAYDSAQGSNEIITNGKDGILIANRSSEMMCNEIIRLWENKVELKKMSDEAFKKADQYSYATCEKAWLSFFEELQDQYKKEHKE